MVNWCLVSKSQPSFIKPASELDLASLAGLSGWGVVAGEQGSKISNKGYWTRCQGCPCASCVLEKRIKF